MKASHFCSLASAVATAILTLQPVMAEPYEVIIRGTVVMQNGGPLPKTVAIERKCSDSAADAPGVLVSGKGEYQWRLTVDPTNSFTCYLHATSKGYESSRIDITTLDGYTSKIATLPPITIFSRDSDPNNINPSDTGIPGKAGTPWRAAIKALQANKKDEAIAQLDAAVKVAPFARGYHALGVLHQEDGNVAAARKDFEQAIAADPKMVAPYVLLTKICVQLKDWKCVAANAEGAIQQDPKHSFPQVFLHQAVALYEMKDLAGAEAAAREGIRLDPTHNFIPRVEYVLGRILDAKGDHKGAKEQLDKYLSIDKDTPDAAMIKARMTNLGDPDLWEGTDLELI